jgi:hypothetical protein
MNWNRLESSQYGASGMAQARCQSCDKDSYWQIIFSTPEWSGVLLHPPILVAPPAHVDLPTLCKSDYDEARSIARTSPRGAAALLRLVVEKLCVELLGDQSKGINEDIKTLVQSGLSPTVQKALDTLRVTGNEAVHPGTMSSDDHADSVDMLFEFVNYVVQQMITQPKEVAKLYAKLPKPKLDGIEQRDKSAP